jgi:hypothetical protein
MPPPLNHSSSHCFLSFRCVSCAHPFHDFPLGLTHGPSHSPSRRDLSTARILSRRVRAPISQRNPNPLRPGNALSSTMPQRLKRQKIYEPKASAYIGETNRKIPHSDENGFCLAAPPPISQVGGASEIQRNPSVG